MESDVLSEHADEEAGVLNEYEARNVLREYDVPCPTEVLLEYEEGKSPEAYFEECASMDDRPDFPVYVKVLSRDISSMSDAGGIEHATSKESFLNAVENVLSNVQEHDSDAAIEGVLVSADVSGDTRELLLGATVDPEFGHVVSLGVGGIYVEAYADVEFRTVPLESADVESMIERLDGSAIFEEFRGMDPVDTDAVVDAALKLSTLIEENPEITEIDVNPLMAGPDGVVAADALIGYSTDS